MIHLVNMPFADIISPSLALGLIKTEIIVIAMSAFHDLLPRLAGAPLGAEVRLFFHVKSNLKRSQLETLAAAGVTDVGPGIESLSSHLLGLMRKGVTALQNVYFLKCCAELGLHPRWTNLIRVPGEQPEDYRQMEDWIPKVMHLSPPSGAGEIQLHRFSPYYFERERWVEGVRSHGVYRALYPEDHVALERVAYVFEGDWKDCLPAEQRAGVVRATDAWRKRWMNPNSRPVLRLEAAVDTAVQLFDTRGAELRCRLLDAAEACVYHAMAAPVGAQRLVDTVQAGRADLDRKRIEAIVCELVSSGDAQEEGGFYLALATVDRAVTEAKH